THFASAVLKKSRVVRMMDRATGGLFLCFAAKLAISTR
ncbi:TPA: LysE family translocator, partial [Enterobacter ludwigii]